MFEIVDLVKDDYQAATRLWQATPGIGEVETEEEFKTYLERNPGLSTAAWSQGDLVGAMLCGHDGRRGYLYHLAVAAEYRSQGIASAMIDRAVDRLQKCGVRRVSIHLYAANRPGAAFWQRLGWRERTDLRVYAWDIPH
ncbi:GNAT family N-acetyltransferase [Lignipirellula cremea]|uniref:Acetyltransferase YpeA n=1 Tax=Lignipirellula cremea TaxID=2528010 RepID=A0A518DSD7_9BACT|nr:GNAT family N-acetyltransferase [Lignipirellula cremea]QDU94751.1 Acetyltransferase YpeA [Lignipirellula cremea]